MRDPMPQLPNQEEFLERLSALLDNPVGGSEVIMLVNLDGFRAIKDAYGYLVGNELLRITAEKIGAGVRKTDTLSHFGGDEFAVLTTGFTDFTELYTLIHRIRGFFNTTWEVLGHEFFMTASMGIVIFFPNGGASALDLLRNAASALARAKERGRNQFQVYQPGWNERLVQHHQLEVEFRHAVGRQELELHYQPQVDTHGQIRGFEALLRWRHPVHGLMSPGAFLELAEETGLWLPLGEWVLREACRQARVWRDTGLPPVSMAVNVSANQLQQNNFFHLVQGILDETGLEPSGLEIEITEGAVIKAMQSSVHNLVLLRSRGIRIALDDFGTGYSSLSYLKDLPVDVLKIDRSFVKEIGRSQKSDAVLGAVLLLAEALELEVVGEGVETSGQFEFLVERHCGRIQGYLFSRPQPAADAARLLADPVIRIVRDLAGG